MGGLEQVSQRAEGAVVPHRDEEGIGPYGWPADTTHDAALRELLVQNGEKGH